MQGIVVAARRSMYPWAQKSLLFASSILVIASAYGFVAVYVFDSFEPMWRADGTFAVYLWVSTLYGALCLVGSFFRIQGSTELYSQSECHSTSTPSM